MARTTSLDSFLAPSEELCEAIKLLRETITLNGTYQATLQFRGQIEWTRLRLARLHLYDLIEIMDQRIPTLKDAHEQTREKAKAAFHSLNARDRQGMRTFYREELRIHLGIHSIEDPPHNRSLAFQATQATRRKALTLFRQHQERRHRWFRDIMPISVFDDFDIRENLRRHADDAARMEMDQIALGRELHTQFRNMNRDDQFLFLRWYSYDLEAHGINWDPKLHKFTYVGVRTALTAARSDQSDF